MNILRIFVIVFLLLGLVIWTQRLARQKKFTLATGVGGLALLAITASGGWLDFPSPLLISSGVLGIGFLIFSGYRLLRQDDEQDDREDASGSRRRK